MSNINEIVDVQIAIESPPLTTEAFSKMLIVAPAPTLAGTSTADGAIAIRQAKELTSYGFSTDSYAYRAAQVAFAQTPGPSMLYVIARELVTPEDPQETPTEETVAATLDRALETNDWYGVCLAGYEGVSDLRSAADWCGANNKLFGFAWNGANITLDISGYDRTFAIYNGDTDVTPMPDGNTFAHIALMAKCFGYEPGSETWANKTLTGVVASKLTSAKIASIKADNSNYYHNVGNKDIVQTGCVGSTEWIDTIRLVDWLTVAIQERVYGFIVANKKVPYNDAGITGIQNQIESVLRDAQQSGGIDSDRIDENGNTERGYEVVVPRATEISAAERRSRSLYGVYFIARLASAIHFVQIRGTLTY